MLKFPIIKEITRIFAIQLCVLVNLTFCNEPDSGISGNIFGRKGGHFHPFLSIHEYYADNIFFSETDSDEEKDFYTLITPGLLLAFPGKKVDTPGINYLSSTIPGGRISTGLEKISQKRIQAGLICNSVMQYHSKNTELDYNYPNLDGIFQYRFLGGLTFNISGQYQKHQDSLKNSSIDEFIEDTLAPDETMAGEIKKYNISKYSANRFAFKTNYIFSERIEFAIDYSSFSLNYEEDEDNYKDRMDQIYSMSIFCNILTRTAIFIEYNLSELEYEYNSILDSELKKYFAGIRFYFSDKFLGILKAGLGEKDLKAPGIDDSSNFILNSIISYSATDKTKLMLNLFRGITETDIKGSEFVLVNSAGLSYNQKLSERLSSEMDISISNGKYEGGNWDGYMNIEYSGSISLTYTLNGWLQGKIELQSDNRASDFEDGDYNNNLVSIGLNFVI